MVLYLHPIWDMWEVEVQGDFDCTKVKLSRLKFITGSGKKSIRIQRQEGTKGAVIGDFEEEKKA